MTAHRVPLLICDQCRTQYLGPVGPDPDATIPETRKAARATDGWRTFRVRQGDWRDYCGPCLEQAGFDPSEVYANPA